LRQKNERHRKLIHDFKNPKKDNQTERLTDRSGGHEFLVQRNSGKFVTHFVILFFQLFMYYTAVYQQGTVHGAHQNFSTVTIDSLSRGEIFSPVGLGHSVPICTEVKE
jgi:hypothetical protein